MAATRTPTRSNAPQRGTPPRTPPPHASSSHTYQSFDELVRSPQTGSPILATKRNLRGPSDGGAAAGAASADSEDSVDDGQCKTPAGKKHELSTLDFVKLTIGIGGAQLAWTVEMAYGTPYLLALGLTKQGTSLVWMAGPLSGMIVQPVVGALSDSSASRFRRRKYIFFSAVFILVATLVVAYARELAALLVSAFTGVGDWDPAREEREQTCAIWLGVLGFYVLDFSLNALQASIRALVLDLSPSSLQSTSNAWLGRQTHIANVVGYLIGYVDLGHSPLLHWLGGGQFRKLAVISCAAMVATVGVTCWTQVEEARPELRTGEGMWAKIKGIVRDVVANVRTLPRPVRRVCYVQFFAWTSWFPFLFYSTTYVAEAFYASIPPGTPPPSADTATRVGSFALLIYAIVSLAAGAFIPYLTTLGDSFPSLPARVGPVGRWVLSEITPRNVWTVSLAWYAACMLATFWTRGVGGATAVVALAGVPWAITCWVPYALVMEEIREVEAARLEASTPRDSPLASPPDSPADAFSPARRILRAPFRTTDLRQPSWATHTAQQSEASTSPIRSVHPAPTTTHERASLLPRTRPTTEPKQPAATAGAGGTILGLHNLAVVFPQLFVALVAAGIFRLTTHASSKTFFAAAASMGGEGELRGENDVVWVLRFGGLASALGVVASRWVEETASERAYRERVLYGWADAVDTANEEDARSE